MSIIIYYHYNLKEASQLCAEYFLSSDLLPALARVENLRKSGCHHVCISSEDPNSIGQPGVLSVENGKTPNGEIYDWKKRRV